MRAAQYTEHGGPERLEVVDREAPHPGPGEVRIAVRAAGVNPLDWKLLSGLMSGGAPLAGPVVPGHDAAGVVDEVGEGADAAIGDEVLGIATSGSFAEHAVLDAWAPRPASVPWEQAGGLPVAAETAVRCLHLLGLRAGDVLVVDGAAGGVGQALVQVARARGVEVVGTASARNHPLLQALGARATTYGPGLVDRVRAVAPGGVAGAVDTAGKGSLAELAELTGAPERVVTIADFSGSVPGVVVTGGGEIDRAGALRTAAELAADGRLVLPVVETYPLERLAAAHERSVDGHVAGKLVVLPG